MIEQIKERMVYRALHDKTLPRYALLGRAERAEAEALGYSAGTLICASLRGSQGLCGLLVTILPVDKESWFEVV
jgi:hypothetical protein